MDGRELRSQSKLYWRYQGTVTDTVGQILFTVPAGQVFICTGLQVLHVIAGSGGTYVAVGAIVGGTGDNLWVSQPPPLNSTVWMDGSELVFNQNDEVYISSDGTEEYTVVISGYYLSQYGGMA